jgi:hypothetical protein
MSSLSALTDFRFVATVATGSLENLSAMTNFELQCALDQVRESPDLVQSVMSVAHDLAATDDALVIVDSLSRVRDRESLILWAVSLGIVIGRNGDQKGEKCHS